MNELPDKKGCVFLAPLDSVLQQSAAHYEPLLRFFGLLNRHIVLTDTQLLDNPLFWDDSVTPDLGEILHEEGSDGLPLVLISQRNPDKSLLEILLEDMARAGKRSGSPPMHFSSLTRARQAKLHELWKQGRVTQASLERDVQYPLSTFARRAAKLVQSAGYADSLRWPEALHDPGNYFALFCDMLACQSLETQAGVKSKAGRSFLTRMREHFQPLAGPNFSRTFVYREMERLQRGRVGRGDRDRVPSDDLVKVRHAIRAMADYAYLRHFSDRSGFSFLLDNSHWLASSVVNSELQPVRPAAEAVDDFVERCLDVQEGAFGGFGSQGHATLSTLLRRCGFVQGATWEGIVALRRQKSFSDRLDQIDASIGTVQSGLLIREHLATCFSALLKAKFDWDGFLANSFVGGVGLAGAAVSAISPTFGANLAQAALGFATAGGGSALILGGLHRYRRWRQGFLIDRITNSVVSEFQRRRHS